MRVKQIEVDIVAHYTCIFARSTVARYVAAVRDEGGIASEGKLGYSTFPMVCESLLLRNQTWFEWLWAYT